MSRMKKGLRKRVMSVILSGAMVMSCMPSLDMTAFASEVSNDTGGVQIPPERVSECTAELTEEIGTQFDFAEEEIKTEFVTEDTEEIAAEEQGNKTEQNSVEPVVEKEVLESSSENGVQQEEAEPAAQADTSVSGTDWTLGTDGKLTITSDAGMTDWIGKAKDNKAKVKTVEIQNGVTSIGVEAFQDCSNLTSIEIPNSVTKIDKRAIKNCSGLTDITIPESVTSIGWSAFEGCSGLTSIVIPDSVTEVDISAFKNCTSLASVKISENVTNLGSVFNGCTSLKSVIIPKNVKSIQGAMFSGCTSLESVTIEGKLTCIQGSVFQNCTSLTSITIPYAETGVQNFNLGPSAFEGCTKLTSVKIMPSGIKTTIYADTFKNCSSLTSINLPKGTTVIATEAFSGCSSLESITIPSEVTNIGSNAFENCTSLTSVTFLPTTPPNLDNNIMADGNPQEVFKGCKFVTDNVKGKGIYVPLGTAKTYQEKWPTWAYYIEPKLDITTQPTAPKDVQNGQSVTFSVAAEGEGTIKYQWQVDKKDGKGFVDLDGETSTTYTISPVNKTIHNGYIYRCVVTSDETGSITSNEVVLTVRDSDAEKIAKAKPIAQAALDQFIAYNSTTANSFQWTIREALSAAGIKDVGNKAVITKIEATTKAEGSITGTLTLTCGDATDTLEINKTIAMLISKADAAKQVVNNTIDGLTVTNETTHDSIQKEIDAALTKEGITGVTATVQPIAKEEATVHDKGFISFNVVIECETEDTVTIGPKILWIEVPDTDKVTAAKKVVNDTLKGLTATNDMTKEDIQTAVNDALKKEKLPSVTAVVGEISKTAATTEAAGSISGTITITCGTETDTVALEKTIAQLSALGAAKAVVEEALEGFTATNDTTKEDIQAAIDAALSKAGITSATAAVGNIIKREATTANTGSIDGTITIQCGTETDKVVLRKTIAKVLVSDADKVKAAKEVVENALKELKVTNDTTKADIQTAIDTAFSTEGITDATATVGEISKTAATTEVLGSISGTITIQSGTETDIVTFEKLIARLPALETAKAVVEKTLEELTVTNDTTRQDIYTAISKAIIEAGITHITIIVGDISKTEATIDTEGSISGKVTIKHELYGTETDTVNVSKTIAKLSETPDGQDVEKAKKIIEDALKETTITNDTTKDDILETLKKAFGDEGTVESVEVTKKTNATQDTAGSLDLEINVLINGKTITINTTAPIQKLSSKTGMCVNFTDYYKVGDDSKPCYKYTGTAVKPAVEVYHNDKLLTVGNDYTISYKNNTKVGSMASLIVKGKRNYSGNSNVVNFTIVNADINHDTDHPTEMTVVAGTKVDPVIMNGTKRLTAKDYKLTGDGLDKGKYAAATAAGVFNTLTVTGIGSYEGSSFNIQVKVIDKDAAKKLAVAVDKSFKPVYNGSALNFNTLLKSSNNPNGMITVTDSKEKGKVLEQGQHFTVVCASNLTNAGTVKFTLTGMGEYAGSVSKTFKLSPLKVTDSSKFSVTFDAEKTYEYKASGTVVDNLVVKYLGETASDTDDQILRQGIDYKISYSNNKKVSASKNAQFKITFLGNYKGSAPVVKDFKVNAAKLSAANTFVTVPDMVYSKANKAYKSKPIVTVDGVAVKTSDYDVSYKWATESKAEKDAEYTSDDKVKITIAEGDHFAKVKVMITPKGSYLLAEGAVIEGEYYVRKADGAVDLSKAKVTFHDKAGNQLKNLEYNGAAFHTPAGNSPDAGNASDDVNAVYVKVTVQGKEVDPELYDVTWTNATAKGKATVVICGKGITTQKGTAVGSRTQSISIKAMALKGRDLKTLMEKAAKNLKKMMQ